MGQSGENFIEDHSFTPFLKKLTVFTSGGPFEMDILW